MVIARVTDNVGINISNAGIGHQMSLMLDGSKACPDVPHYYIREVTAVAAER